MTGQLEQSMTRGLREKLLTPSAFQVVEVAIDAQRQNATSINDPEWTLVGEVGENLMKKNCLTSVNLAKGLRERTKVYPQNQYGIRDDYMETTFLVTLAYLAAYLEQPLRRDANVITDEMVVETVGVLLEQAKRKKDFQLQDCQSIRAYIATVLGKPQISNPV
jgi:hypothetical protein